MWTAWRLTTAMKESNEDPIVFNSIPINVNYKEFWSKSYTATAGDWQVYN